jgi:hypothetical protein
MAHRSEVEPEPLLAGDRSAGMLVWWPLFSVLYLLVVPGWQPLGVAALGLLLALAAVLRAVWRHRSGPSARA